MSNIIRKSNDQIQFHAMERANRNQTQRCNGREMRGVRSGKRIIGLSGEIWTLKLKHIVARWRWQRLRSTA